MAAAAGAGSVFVRFPPKWRHILIPTTSRRAAALGITLYTASRSRPLAAQRALWSFVRLGSPRLIPGPREQWSAPLIDDAFAELSMQWSDIAGPSDGIAVYHRLQSSRGGLVLMYCAGRRSMLVRLRENEADFVLERRISGIAERMPHLSFRVPRVVGAGGAGGWHWIGFELIARFPHAPSRAVPRGAFRDIAALVERALPRPDDVPPHWRGAHGDLCPWNFRRARHQHWLIDWEHAGWAPPGSDAVYFAATRSALHREPTHQLAVPSEVAEARAFWAAQVERREYAEVEAQLHRRLSVLLAPSPPGPLGRDDAA